MVGDVVSELSRALLVMATALAVLPLVSWIERVLSPTRGRRGLPRRGALHAFAVALKLLEKRAAEAPGTDRTLHAASPVLALLPTMAVLGVLPLVPSVEDARLRAATEPGALALVIALPLLSTVAVTIAGVAGNNRLALLDALRFMVLRATVLVVVGCAALSVARAVGSLGVLEIAARQAEPLGSSVPAWGIVRAPIAFVAATLATAMLAAHTARMRSESSLFEPWLIEAAGPVQLGHRVWMTLDLFAQAAILSSLFLGAGSLPGVTDPSPALSLCVAIAKALAMTALIMAVGGGLPPLRHADAVRFCWTLLLPLAVASLVVTELLSL